MLNQKNILIIFNADILDNSENLEDFYEIKEEEQLRGGIVDVASRIGSILSEKAHAEVSYFKVIHVEQLSQFLSSLESLDLVVNLCEPIFLKPNHEGDIAELLEQRGLTFTGNRANSLRLSMNKNNTNELLKRFGLPHVDSMLFIRPVHFESWLNESPRIEFPLIVKLNFEDSSLGIAQNSIVRNEEELARRVRAMFRKYKQPVLLQRYIEGREIHVAYYGYQPVGILGVSELDFTELAPGAHPIYTYAAKWDTNSEDYQRIYICETKMEESVQEKLRTISKSIISEFGFYGYGRLDYRFSPDGVPYLIDPNPNCNISDSSCFAVLADRIGLTYEELIIDLCTKALEYGYNRLDSVATLQKFNKESQAIL